ncbi:AcrR family transcriptional regulator [Salirhabdus euzebyi]|uniref:AcrR family transcriptional regulator n=1 Tax=Salirhabdus euzebyi TaxID=394506 RepID=A0A841Q4N2_9BACI|nr:TetR/AcrR family transcriptional regulator [Salirhabdus euzebyi]MBB6453337.1 AcrR family transcriptional regulator [Salirhabdus euzebyi]
MPKVTEEYKQQKRNLILDCAMECFAVNGYQESTIDDIVAKSGMSKGAVYNYFKSKDDIYLTLLDRNTEKTFDYLSKGFDNFTTATEKIKHMLKIYFQITYKEDDLWLGKQRVHLEFWINASQNEELRKAMEEHAEKFITFLEKMIDEGKANGEFRQDIDSRITSEAFWALNDGVRLHLLVAKEKFPFSKVYEHIDRLYMNFLKGITT